ncbi:MAG: hypothetical protein OEV06_07485 [Anaerolineae bacterium]|nr:hypothetical protein [Anaerolineae bacterium]
MTDENIAWSVVPQFILYSDGQVFVTHYEYSNKGYLINYLRGEFSQVEMCEFLLDIENAGFFDYDPESYIDPGITDMGDTEISVTAWEENYLSAYGLGRSDSDEILSTYKIITTRSIPNLKPYIPDEIALMIYPYRWENSAPLWPFEDLPISQLVKQAVDDVVVLSGDEAERVFNHFDNRLSQTFREKEYLYEIIIKPIFPFERFDPDRFLWGAYSGFHDTPKTKLSCPPIEPPIDRLFDVKTLEQTSNNINPNNLNITVVPANPSNFGEISINKLGEIYKFLPEDEWAIPYHNSFSIAPDGHLWFIYYDEINPTERGEYESTLVHISENAKVLGEFTSIAGSKLTCEDYIVEALPSGQVALADTCAGNVLLIGEDGQLIRQWGKLGASLGDFNVISQLFYINEPDPILFIVDSEKKSIILFNLEGKFIDEWPTSDFGVGVPLDIFVQANGTVYLLDFETNNIVRKSWDGAITIWQLPDDDYVNSIAISPSGEYILVGGRDAHFYVYEPSGTLLGKEHVVGSSHVLVDFLPNGLFYASTQFHRIYLFEIVEN